MKANLKRRSPGGAPFPSQFPARHLTERFSSNKITRKKTQEEQPCKRSSPSWALVAYKLKIPVAHVEAGIRQQPKDMPEEINRVLVDHISAQLFCCSNLAARNLAHEGITSGGYQKEAYYAGKRAVVLMPDTGWRELVETGWNLLCDADSEQIAHTITTALTPAPRPENIFGEGNAGECIVGALLA